MEPTRCHRTIGAHIRYRLAADRRGGILIACRRADRGALHITSNGSGTYKPVVSRSARYWPSWGYVTQIRIAFASHGADRHTKHSTNCQYLPAVVPRPYLAGVCKRMRAAVGRRLSVDRRSLVALRVSVGLLLLADLLLRSRSLVFFYTDAGVLPRSVLFSRFPFPGCSRLTRGSEARSGSRCWVFSRLWQRLRSRSGIGLELRQPVRWYSSCRCTRETRSC